MFHNYIIIAWRNIVKRRFYSLLNIAGIAVGIVFTLLIGAYTWQELNINRHLHNSKNLYFLKSIWEDPNLGNEITTIGPIARRLKEDYPSLVSNYYRWDGITSIVTKDDKHFREGIQLGDSTLLSMFGFELLHGNARTALTEPYSVVITRQIANKYFGREDVVGETIGIQSFSSARHDFMVTGVLKDIPENSVINLNSENNNQLFIPTNTYSYFPRTDFEDCSNFYLPSYIEVRDGITAKDLEKPLRQLIQQNGFDQLTKDKLTIKPVRLTEYYLNKDNGLARRMLYALAVAGFFILLMAIVNFINISISNSSTRIKEIGVRKAMGSRKRQIIFQFLIESVVLVFIATGLALLMYPLLQNYFAQLVGKAIPSLSGFPVYFIIIPGLLVIIIGLLAGIYPALALSSLKAADSLKGKLKSVREKLWLRKSLAGLQFTIAAIVMIAAFIVTRQVAYFFGNALGYNKEYVVASQVPRDWSPQGVRNMEAVRNEFARMPEVGNVTLSYEIPNGMNSGQPALHPYGGDSSQAIAMQMLTTDEYYLDTYQIPMAAGSFFNPAGSFDSSKVLLNETAARLLGWNDPSQAIGQRLAMPSGNFVVTVSGVVKDFHFHSLAQKIQPFLFTHVRSIGTYRYLSFRIKPGKISSSIDAISKKWTELLPGTSFEYRFMDDVLKKLYQNEIQLKKASYAATVLSLIIVLLGVLGMVSLTVQKRTKEIGIRKVLGASVGSVISLFMKEFISIIIIAGAIACPLAWLLMRSWLNNYAYRISLTATPFFAAILFLGITTVLLITFQTVRIGLASPVKSLRSE